MSLIEFSSGWGSEAVMTPEEFASGQGRGDFTAMSSGGFAGAPVLFPDGTPVDERLRQIVDLHRNRMVSTRRLVEELDLYREAAQLAARAWHSVRYDEVHVGNRR